MEAVNGTSQNSGVVLVVEAGSERALVKKGGKEAARLLGYPSEPNTISLIEAAYLAYIGQAIVIDNEGRRLSFRDIIKIALRQTPYAWVMFEVFYDLRRRGKIPVPGPHPHSLLIRKNKKSTRYSHYVLVLEESRRFPVDELYSFVEESMHNRWEPVVAIVDSYGDITYYSLRPLHPPQQKQKDEKPGPTSNP